MSRGIHRFREREMVRAINATKKAGLDVQRIDVHRDGTYSIIPVGPATNIGPPPLLNDFNRELERELAAFNIRTTETVTAT